MNLSKYAHLLVLLMFLSACSVNRSITKDTSIEMPSQFRDVATNDTMTIASIGWNKFYTSPELQELIEKALLYNFDLQLAVQRIEIAEQYAKQAKLLWLPELGVGISGSYNRASENGSASTLGTYENYNLGLNFGWEIDIWGEIKNQKKIALTEYLQSYEVKNAVQTTLIFEISIAYYRLLLLDKQLATTTENLSLADSSLLMTTALYKEGEVTELAVQQIKAQRESIAVLIPQIEQEIAIQENALQELTGQFPDKVLRNNKLHDIYINDILSTGLPTSLLSNRPDVRNAELGIHTANYKIGVARSNMYPSLFITAEGGLEALKASDWFNMPTSLFGMVAGSLAQPVFNRRKLKTEYEVAKLERDQSVTIFRQTVVGAVKDVSDILVSIEKLKKQEEIINSQVEGLNGVVSNARMLYKEGMVNYLEVMTAQTTALDAELNLSRIRYLRLCAISDLYRSLGGGTH